MASAALTHFFARFDCPFQIFNDQGRNFKSKLFVAVCELFKIHKGRTTPYHPSANGQVERYNRTLRNVVRCYIDKAQDRWDEHLAQIAGAWRSAVNRCTGFTANKPMLGREVNTPAHLMYPPPLSAEQPDLDADMADLQRSMLLAHEAARYQLRKTEKRLKRDYNLKMRSHTYEVKDFVYILETTTVKGKCWKLSPS
jgi:transposase InsO family protein